MEDIKEIECHVTTCFCLFYYVRYVCSTPAAGTFFPIISTKIFTDHDCNFLRCYLVDTVSEWLWSLTVERCLCKWIFLNTTFFSSIYNIFYFKFNILNAFD